MNIFTTILLIQVLTVLFISLPIGLIMYYVLNRPKPFKNSDNKGSMYQ